MTAPLYPLSLGQIAQTIQATPQILRQILILYPPEAAIYHPQPEEWSANEVIGHLIEADKNGFDGRIRHILQEDMPHFTGWAVDEVAQQRRDDEKDVFDLLTELSHMRQKSANLVLALQDDELTRAGVHPMVGELSVNDLLYEWVHHDDNHIKQILSNIQAFLWPSLGQAQGFSGLL